MDVFGLRDSLIRDYSEYTQSFLRIRDPRIGRHVDDGETPLALRDVLRVYVYLPGG